MGAGASAFSAGIKVLSDTQLKDTILAMSEEERSRLARIVAECAAEPSKASGLVEDFGEGYAAHMAAAVSLDRSDDNRTNIKFSRLSQHIAHHFLSMLQDVSSPKEKLSTLQRMYTDLASEWNKGKTKPPFCVVEGVLFAINALKFSQIKESGHIVISVPFFKEFERGSPATPENPNGEESPIQKLEEALFLLSYNKNITMDLVFVNDSVAEKQDKTDSGDSSVKLFKKALLTYAAEKKLVLEPAAPAEDFEHFTALDGQLHVHFTSVEAEVLKGSSHESADEKRKRMENRGADGKLRERKGGAVLSGMERPLEEGYSEKPNRAIRVLLDGDSTIPVACFIGDAAYSILELGHTAYLANLKHSSTVQSILGGGADGDATQARVQNRKLFFSGFTVPFLFPELTLKYKYTGTTQLPAKAFRGDIDFAKGKLPTVQPNVDLGCLALLVSYLNTQGGTIDAGPISIRDNIASSTMTTSDLANEWEKTYGPIFISAVGLCRDLKPTEFAELPGWLTKFIESMELKHYTTLFGDSTSPDVDALFNTMKKFRDAEDRGAVLAQLKGSLEKLFPGEVV